MKNKHLLMQRAARAVLIGLLFGVAGLTKGYAYDVIIGSIANGTVVANPTTANAGETVTLTATPRTPDLASEYFLQSWSVLDGDNNSIAVTQGDNPNISTFIMPSSDVTVTATFSRTYFLYLLFEDFQACEDEIFDGTGRGNNIACLQLPWGEGLWERDWYWYSGSLRNEGYLWLAQNEREGFQLFFHELEKERNLRIEVSPFLNTQNEVLQHSVYYEEFFYAEGMQVGNSIHPSATDSLAEALIPYSGEIKRTSIGHNKAFFIELRSTKNQTPGEYISTITVYDGNTIFAARTVYAEVWNFALPDNHYSDVVMGLYNRNSTYGATSSLFKLNGINVDAQGNVAESDLPAAKQILDGYQECLLEHGVSTFEIPRWKMADDPKAAELTMADPRRTVFAVPVNPSIDFNGSVFNSSAQEVIANYKNLVYDNPFLRDKAYFYLMDEISANEGTEALLSAMSNNLTTLWPGYHAVVTFNEKNGGYSEKISMLEGKTDIFCPNQVLFDPYGSNWDIKQANFEDFKDRDNHPDRFRTWRYQGNIKSGGTDFFVFPTQTPGVVRRIPFWQQYLMNSDGWLQWNCAYLPNDWTKKKLYANGDAKKNGDGVLLYPGTMFGQSAETPIVSLRLKQLSAGIDDYDYLRLAKEFLDDDDIHSILSIIYRSDFETNCKMLNFECNYYDAWTHQHLHKARYELGQLLSAANTEHDWGEWQTAVLPDDTHNGLEIRTCSHCGTQENRPKTYSSLYRFVGTENDQWANLGNWANNPEILPTSGEAVVIASNCEINTDITVFNVIVNDGVNLTITDSATLTSRRVSTEGNAQVIIEDGAQLYTMSEGVQATVKKNIAPRDTDGWYFISSSVDTDVVPSTDNGIVSTIAENYDLYFYDEPAHYWRNYKESSNSQNPNFNLEPLKGYLYANAEGATLSFAGTLQPGITATSGTLSYEAQTLTGWNLVGNPFPCNAYVNRSYYKMNDEGTAIEPTAVSSTTAIAPCTGMMVKAEGIGESVTFSKTAPETQGQNNGMLQIAVAENTRGNATQDKAIISFNQGDALEKFVFGNGNARIYIPQGGKDYAIACVENEKEMPLNFKAEKNGTYTISVNADGKEFNYLHLIDNFTGTDIDLLATPSYSFEARTTDYVSRFKLVFICEDADGDNDNFALFSNGSFVIHNEGNATLQVVDVLGRVIMSETINGCANVNINPAAGIYMLRLINGDKVKVQKMVIQ